MLEELATNLCRGKSEKTDLIFVLEFSLFGDNRLYPCPFAKLLLVDGVGLTQWVMCEFVSRFENCVRSLAYFLLNLPIFNGRLLDFKKNDIFFSIYQQKFCSQKSEMAKLKFKRSQS